MDHSSNKKKAEIDNAESKRHEDCLQTLQLTTGRTVHLLNSSDLDVSFVSFVMMISQLSWSGNCRYLQERHIWQLTICVLLSPRLMASFKHALSVTRDTSTYPTLHILTAAHEQASKSWIALLTARHCIGNKNTELRDT